MDKPQKPHRDFPLFPHANGQWAKKFYIRRKHSLKYFGPWADDRKGERALRGYLARKDAILAGLDDLRVTVATEGLTLGELMGRFLDRQRLAMLAGDLSPATYDDYVHELQAFTNAAGTGAVVAALRPEHFATYNKHLIETRKLGRHARKRVIAYVKAMLNWGAGNGLYPHPTYGNDFIAPDTRPDAIRQAKAREGKKDHSKRIVTGKEVKKLARAASKQMAAIVLLGVNCGLGPADIGRLRWRHINMKTGELNMPRGKTGTERRGYLWKTTRKALRRVARLNHSRSASKRDGQDALAFWTRTGLPLYREQEIIEDGVSQGVKIDQAISGPMYKLVKKVKLEGVSHYRLRHTFKTLGKRAKDRDAINLMMGHREGSTGEIYDHEEIEFARIKRVAIAVFRSLWPSEKHAGGKQKPVRSVPKDGRRARRGRAA
jgi:integrase